MKVRMTVSGLALSAGLALTMAPTGLAHAAPQDGGSVKVASHAAATTKAEQQRIETYWTPSRMKNAIPVGAKVDSQAAKKPNAAASAVQETPQPRFGKVFFTLGGSNYVCSGTATSSSNGDVVTTAGHCLNEGPGAFATNFAFVPAYDNGAAPYGTWTAQTLYTTSAWAGSGDFDYDVGFAVMNENALGPEPDGRRGRLPDRLQPGARPDLQGLRLPRRQAPSTARRCGRARAPSCRTPSAAARTRACPAT